MAIASSMMPKAIAQNPASNSNTDATNPSILLYPALSKQPVGLIGRAVLPADTFYPGPTSGQFLTPGAPSNNKPVPFSSQPVQGFSAIGLNRDRTYLLMADNGYGAKNNSADFLLGFYRLRANFKTAIHALRAQQRIKFSLSLLPTPHSLLPIFKTAKGGSGDIKLIEAVRLSDPNRKAGFTITADLTAYPQDISAHPFPGVLSNFPVDPSIKSQRLLTGMDFDPESFRRAPDGSFWIGDEFGPYLLHTDSQGKLLEAPYSVPIPAQLKQYGRGADVFRSPQNPAFFDLPNNTERLKVANINGSKGFEGMALSPDGTKLYPLLEGPMIEDPDQTRLVISEFDVSSKRFTGRVFFYKLAVPATTSAPNRTKIGDMTAVNDREFLVIETDDGQGFTAAFKKIFKIDISRVNEQGFVSKEEIIDLLNIPNPNNLATNAPAGSFGTGNPFKFPFATIESVQILDGKTILISNDNNYPTTGGNGRRSNETDDNELILLRLAKPLRVTTRN